MESFETIVNGFSLSYSLQSSPLQLLRCNRSLIKWKNIIATGLPYYAAYVIFVSILYHYLSFFCLKLRPNNKWLTWFCFEVNLIFQPLQKTELISYSVAWSATLNLFSDTASGRFSINCSYIKEDSDVYIVTHGTFIQ